MILRKIVSAVPVLILGQPFDFSTDGDGTGGIKTAGISLEPFVCNERMGVPDPPGIVFSVFLDADVAESGVDAVSV